MIRSVSGFFALGLAEDVDADFSEFVGGVALPGGGAPAGDPAVLVGGRRAVGEAGGSPATVTRRGRRSLQVGHLQQADVVVHSVRAVLR